MKLATGNFYHTTEDFRYPFMNMEIAVRRNYLAGRMRASSLGRCWTFNYGTRVLRGVNNEAATDEEKELRKTNLLLNHYALIQGDAEYIWQTGSDTVSLFDENGSQLLYYITTPPDMGSNAWCTEGIRNYYPQGTELTAAEPHVGKLQLLPDGSFLYTKPDNTRHYYNFRGRLVKQEDLHGNSILFDYNNSWQLIRIRDGAGREVQIDYTDGLITGITDPAGRHYVYTYDEARRLASYTDAAGATTSYSYNGDLITAITRPDGSSIRYFHKELNSRQVLDYDLDEHGNPEFFAYYPEAGYTEYTDRAGVMTRCYFDAELRNTRIEYADRSAVIKEYNAAGNLIQFTDELGRMYAYTYDERGNLLTAANAAGKTESWSYNSLNLISAATDKAGNTTSYVYDDKGSLLSVHKPDGTTVYYGYNDKGRLTSFTDQTGTITAYGYDVYGCLSSVRVEAFPPDLYENDILGNVLRCTDQAGNEFSCEYNADNRVTRETDAYGYSRVYTYNNRKDLTSITDRLGNTTRFVYDNKHNLLQVINPLGETVEYTYRPDDKPVAKNINGLSHTTYSYNSRGNPAEKKQVELDISVRYYYDAAGRLTCLSNPEGRTTMYYNNGADQVASIMDAAGSQRFEYNANGQVISAIDRNGSTTLYCYDHMGRLVQITNALQDIVNIGYDRRGYLSAYTSRSGKCTEYTYNTRGLLEMATDPAGNSELYTYDARGLQTRYTDKKGSSTTYEYDKLGRLVKATDAIGGTESFAYDAEDNLVSRTDAAGNTTAYSYDALKRLVSRTDAYGNTTQVAYNCLGKPDKVIKPDLTVQGFEYDASGRLVKAVNELGAERQYAYDANGNVIRFIDEVNNVTEYTYDRLNRLTGKCSLSDPLPAPAAARSRFVVLPPENRITYSYDNEGRLIFETDAKGNTHGYRYDALGRLTSETDRLFNIQSYTYDADDNLLTKTSFAGDVITCSYDVSGQLTTETTSDGAAVFEYDANGNLVKAANSTETLLYEYDKLNRLVSAGGSATANRTEYAYDQAGNRSIVKNIWNGQEQATAYAYGKLNELLKLTEPDGSVISYAYDNLNRPVHEQRPDGTEVFTGYDAAGRVRSLKYTDAAGAMTKLYGYVYNKAGKRTHQVDEQGNFSMYSYDTAGRLTTACYPFESGKVYADFEERLDLGYYTTALHQENAEKYTYLETGAAMLDKSRLETMLQSREDIFRTYHNLPAGTEVKWQIDEGYAAQNDGGLPVIDNFAGEVITELQELYISLTGNPGLNMSGKLWKECYTYDRNSNRTAKENGWGRISYEYDAADRMTKAGHREYAYNASGALVEERLGSIAAACSHNRLGQLTEVQIPMPWFLGDAGGSGGFVPANVQYAYDALGRRSSSVTKAAVRSRVQIMPEPRIQYSYDGFSVNVLREFRNLSSLGYPPVTDLVRSGSSIVSRTEYTVQGGMMQQEVKDYLYQDVLGSTVMATDPAGTVKQRFDYDAFGSNYGDKPAFRMNYLFTGKPLDSATGIMNYGYRDYKPAMGRFTKVDPIRDGDNWYVYVNNDPVNYIDLLGLEGVDGNTASPTMAPRPTPEPAPTPPPYVLAGKTENPKKLEFDLYDGKYHCNQLAYNEAVENQKNPGPANINPNKYITGNAYANLVDAGVSHPTKPIENTVGYAYMWTSGNLSGKPQPTHVCYYEYDSGDYATIYWGDGKEKLEKEIYNINGKPSQLPEPWVNKIEFIPIDILKKEE